MAEGVVLDGNRTKTIDTDSRSVLTNNITTTHCFVRHSDHRRRRRRPDVCCADTVLVEDAEKVISHPPINPNPKDTGFLNLGFPVADNFDVVLMIVGTVAAVGNGLSQPAVILIFGELVNSFAFSVNNSVTKEVTKTIALAGEGGSGKSTIINLIERFYDPDEGCVLLDGIDIKRLKLSWLRQQLGLGHATEEEIILATKLANAHNIYSLPNGYDTVVSERGMQLSGGQKQRIAIARAILKDPKILLLDEATSALDTESEHVAQDALETVMVNRTTVIVSHRLTTIKGANIIVVMKNGEIIEKGTHETLMKNTDGTCASLLVLHMGS
ncbi:ABC transporter B family member 9-like [Momordica charantia]|uniref:ABC transporter B family member 9-like n=1 Tax=Momordica charantia TaxID=3673 RepID=A0A6J1CF26_MOMCH|nr:ABC transporter B family member 9-like [Momordica charantia]